MSRSDSPGIRCRSVAPGIASWEIRASSRRAAGDVSAGEDRCRIGRRLRVDSRTRVRAVRSRCWSESVQRAREDGAATVVDPPDAEKVTRKFRLTVTDPNGLTSIDDVAIAPK